MNDRESYFETRFTPDPARGPVWQRIVAYLQQHVSLAGTVVDLGAGYGSFINAVPVTVRRIAVDANDALPQHLDAGVEAIVLDLSQPEPLLDQVGSATVDVVFASNLLEHLERDTVTRLLSVVHSILTPHGNLVLVQPNFRLAPGRYFDDYTHRTIFTDRSLPDLLRASGFEVTRVESRFLPLTVRSRLANGYRLIPLYLKLPFRPFAGQMLVIARPQTPRQDV